MTRRFSSDARLMNFGRGLLVLVAVLSPAVRVAAQTVSSTVRDANAKALPSVLRGVGIEQRLGQPLPLDARFRDESGASVALGDVFGKKPVVLALVYYQCPMLCTMVLNGLLESLKQVKFDVGDQFNVVAVSIDPSEKPELARAKKAVYAGLYGRPKAAQGWHFLTGDAASIRGLAQSVGFHYNYDPGTRQFAHAAAIMVVTPEGKLSRYFYGIQYPARDLRLALVEASADKIGSPIDQVLLFCCEYNPTTGRYGFIIARVLQLAGAVTVLAVGTLMLLLFRREPYGAPGA